MTPSFQNIALVGANGRLGPSILEALLSAKTFKVTVLSRASSKSTYPSSVHITTISDDPSTEELVKALKDQDVIIVAFSGSVLNLQLLLADAAVLARVKRFIPADFGSCDSSSLQALSLIPLYGTKQSVRKYLQNLAAENSGFTWTSLVCGHFFDYGLLTGLLALNIKERKARVFDGGDIRWSTTTIDTIATAVVKVLQKEEETRNKMLYIQSFSLTQNELLKSLEKVTGQSWHIENVDSKEYIKKLKAETDRDPENSEATEDLVGVMGILDADWEKKDDFANGILGIEAEDLDKVVQKVVASSKGT